VPGASVIGGDTARADSVLLAVTGLGDLAGRPPVLRSGAGPGDVVAMAGPLGHAAAGLALLSAGVRDGSLVTAQRRPAPPYDAGPQAADLGATAMIDISDGLLADLGHIADASGVLIDLSRTALGPSAELTAAASSVLWARTDSCSPAPELIALNWVLAGGEDHSLAATFPPGTALPPRWRIIGTVRQAPGPGVVVDSQPWALAPGLMQEVHTLSRLGVPPTMACLAWMLGLKRRGVRRCENETLLPKPGPLPHRSQTEATVSLH
jgi:thiamine-monophosphate kinase